MTNELGFIDLMRTIATDPAARGLNDDAAVITIGGETLIITHDMMVESVHWLQYCEPADVAWKLVASNLSDLAAKGARPIGVMLGYMLSDDDWDRSFADGLRAALAHYDVLLLGGDTVKSLGRMDARSIGMTAMGIATCDPVPSRSGAQAGDALYVTGTLGDAKAGYDLVCKGQGGAVFLRDAFTRPAALIVQGGLLAPVVNAMMDVSDGLLLDASRMAAASGLAVSIDISLIPLSAEYIGIYGDNHESRMTAGSWGDDYQLLFAAADGTELLVPVTKVGVFTNGNGLTLMNQNGALDLPTTLGFVHR